MNIVREQRGENNSLIRVTVGEADYGQEVEKALREYKRKANIPGFRPGMVPMGLVKKMYGKGVLAEQSYRKASNAAFEYLEKEKIDYLGDVIPSEEQGDFDFDFDNATEFEFVFEIGEAPAVNLELSDKDKLTYSKIKVDKKMHDDYRSNYLRRFGRLVDADKVTSDEALTVTLDNGEMNVADAYVGLISMTDEERKPFVGKKVGAKMKVNLNELYKNPAQRAACLQVKENELEGINPEFELEITKIRKFAEPELNEEFFKMAFPQGGVTDEAGFDKFIDAQIESELRRESDYLFTMQLRDYLVKKAGLKMPEAFLKRWLYTINEGKFSMEDIEKDFDQFLKMFTWNYLQKHFIKADNLSVTKEEALAEAKALAAAQFAQYGMPSAPDEMLADYAGKILADKDQGQKIYEKLYEVKVVEDVKSKIKVTEKAVSADDFAKLAKEL
ncbi:MULTISPECIES: trigger factor [Alistipes]|uniref:Trigger factor n=1 Tax=Alistipes intestinihominis TaxID=3133172 RepID=A0ABV1GY64_9BACT|nr:trigger factor [Alistipes senegalensis]MDY4570948.1 trigger factor [Alistipes senegalensis]MDY5240575.1 trigger factor [Alistipes senegalensis]